jgi:ABC-2 type transport system permease protein
VSTQVPRLLGAAVVRLPAVLVLAAVAVLAFGLLPWESVGLAWSAVVLVGLIAVFGASLLWPAWMMDISPAISSATEGLVGFRGYNTPGQGIPAT